MAKPKKARISKVKKKWFAVLAPEVFNRKEIGDVPANEQKSLLGRTVEIVASKLTDVPRDQHRKVVLEITELVGDKVTTSNKKTFLLDNFIQRTSRRFKERFILVDKLPTKDGKLKLKVLILSTRKVHQKVRAALITTVRANLTEKLGKTKTEQLFLPSELDKIGNELKNEVKTIYPIDKIVIWKTELLKN